MRIPGFSPSRRTTLFLLGDVAVFVASMYLALITRYGLTIPHFVWRALPLWFALAVPVKLLSNTFFRVYGITWEFASDRDRLSITLATTTSALVWGLSMHLVSALTSYSAPSNEVLALDSVFTLFGVQGLRFAKRLYRGFARAGTPPQDVRRILLVGAGYVGENLLREMRRRWSRYRPVGIVDDDPAKLGTYLHGVRVLGGSAEISDIIRSRRIDEVIVAMPSAPGQVIREVVDTARTAGVASVRIVPGVAAFLEGRITMETVREVKGEDLLPREAVELDEEAVRGYLRGRTVLVTGAAGSIGSELARQIATFAPRELVLVESDESRLYALHLELRRAEPRLSLREVVADVRDPDRIGAVFAETRPDVVFHAAAYKHVPLMEVHPGEAVLANIRGTQVMAEAASRSGTDVFVLISTDKAVNPTSIMGATKRVAEMIVRRMDEASATRFSAVRFGNVLGSRGSLIPVLEEQIRRGGPVTLTHPAMERYFMTVAAAVSLILAAGSLGTGGEVFVLDMGEPVRIRELAETLIRLSGLEPDVDVPIQFTGVRPGEKLKEEILLAEEGTLATKHGNIFVARLGREPDPHALDGGIAALLQAARDSDPDRIRELLAEIVRTYVPGEEAEAPSPRAQEPAAAEVQASPARGADE